MTRLLPTSAASVAVALAAEALVVRITGEFRVPPASRTTVWIVEAEDSAGPVGPYIPTEGHPTSASDLYRVHGVHETGHKGWNSCLTDQATAAGLAKLIEGPLESTREIAAAEAALQVLLLYDRADVVVPGFKYRFGSLVSYGRQKETRSELAFQLFSDISAYDQIFATERVEVRDDVIVASNDSQSGILGDSLSAAQTRYLERSGFQAAALAAMPLHLGVPAYFSDPLIVPFTRGRGMLGEFHARVSKDWNGALGLVPDFDFSVSLPPLLAIVLDRAANRDDIPAQIRTLRAELAPVRQELHSLSALLEGALDQRAIEERCKDVAQSFSAVVAASRLRDASLLLPILKLYKLAKSPLDSVISALNPQYQPTDPRILADRTITGRTFARLLRTDSVVAMLKHHFTEAERRALAASSTGSANA
jgi:hypothetical protein